ncbi:hypothetical protein P9854_05315 [Serratia nevei]|uniref:YdgH/BhsA/McbA-like domain-containing protein n=1 Tax=Serratia nevei TaxID=2703794 RepID=A0AAW6X2Y4_9GAMM|nr:hypothetical protein [Serratia nevei]MDK4765228.1 hypothetical protein [Serratia nevei]MEC5957112.1 hypothetical protein [Serratia nevei]
MKATKYLLALLAFTSFSSLVAIEITREEAAKHTEIGPVTISQDGDDTVGIDHARLSKAVDEKGGKYYVIIGREGKTTFETINAIAYK